MNKTGLILFVALLTWGSVSGQSLDEDPAVTQMMTKFLEYNKSHQTVRGWRVQILVTTDRRQVETARTRFERKYPDYKIYYSHEKPFYHLKTGAFLTQATARPFLRILQEEYGSAFIVSAEIELVEVLLYQ